MWKKMVLFVLVAIVVVTGLTYKAIVINATHEAEPSEIYRVKVTDDGVVETYFCRVYELYNSHIIIHTSDENIRFNFNEIDGLKIYVLSNNSEIDCGDFACRT